MSVPGEQRNGGSSHPWRWVPSLYYAEGLPYAAAMMLAVVMYKNLELSNTDIALYTSWLYLPWVIKPVWSPVVDLIRTKRWWIVALQLLLGAGFASIALTLPTQGFVRATLAGFWLVAFSSATHDIAADGFYLLALPDHEQAEYVGWRSTCYRLAMITGQGGLVLLAGRLQTALGRPRPAWMIVFALLAALFVALGLYHGAVLPRPAGDTPAGRGRAFAASFGRAFGEFFRKPGIVSILSFLLLYRFAEAQLLKLVTPFLLDHRAVGGLGLTTSQVGLVYGTAGVVALTVGGLTGGYVLARFGLKRLLWPMLGAMYLPNLVFVLLAHFQPAGVPLIGAGLVVEQFGYGFGFTAYLMYMIMVSEGEYRTAHYAICTGFMALGMMLPGMWAGWLEDHLGYQRFFAWMLAASVISFAAAACVAIKPDFGRKRRG